jgi:DNA-directed RNA polymerase specialized sigma24 family protein
LPEAGALSHHDQTLDTDTRIGGAGWRFPETERTEVARAGCADGSVRRVAQDRIAGAYWKPVYKYIRWRWHESNEAAKDLTQGFFAKAVAGSLFADWDPERAAFRTFLRLCVDRYVDSEREYSGRLKRSIAVTEPIEETSLLADFDPDAWLHREWIRELFSVSLQELRAEYAARGRDNAVRAFELYDLSEDPRPTYAEIAAALQVPSTQVTNYLAAVRRDLRRIVLQKLRELTATEREFRSEARAVLGVSL